jgi:putative spermidine/putrescine transport system substrate-binding protein
MLSLVALLAGSLAACGGDGDAGSDGGDEADEVTIVFASGGGAYGEAINRAWLVPFMEANPDVKVVHDMSYGDPAKIKAMVEANNVTWDVIDVGNDFGIGDTTSLLEKLDPSVVPLDELQPETLPSTGYRAPDATIGVIVGYRTEDFPGDKPMTFADFFDLEKFPGKRGCFNYASGGIIEMALLADGVPVEELYPLDLDRAFAKLDTIKDSVIWWETGAQSVQLLVDGEVSMGMSWNGRISTAQAEGAPLEIMWNEFFLTADYLIVPKGTKHPEAAMKLIGYITSAEHNADLAQYIDYGPTNVNAIEKLDPEQADRIPSSHADTAIGWDDEWWAANYDTVNEAWQSWVQQ